MRGWCSRLRGGSNITPVQSPAQSFEPAYLAGSTNDDEVTKFIQQKCGGVQNMELSEAAKEAKREYERQWRRKNKERVREYNRRWREKNRERYNEYHRRWREKNKDKIKEYRRNYWERKAKEGA